MKSTSFYLGLALLFTHEMDSMPNHEWRVLPLLGSLSDSAHPAYEFSSLLSSALIYGAAACGIVYFASSAFRADGERA